MANGSRGRADVLSAVLMRASLVASARPSRVDDEVAIDFPATVELFERARSGFLRLAEGPTLIEEHDVWLTPAEARRGLPVVVDVPLAVPCPTCGGRGESWNEPCEACGTHGADESPRPVRVRFPAGVADQARFRLRVRAPLAERTELVVRVRIGALPAVRSG